MAATATTIPWYSAERIMRIVADANIPFAAEAFSPLGDLVILPASEITRQAVREAELLLVRSTVRVDRALLDGSQVRFVGTATTGYDHLDTVYLESQKITWAAARGCNADSVAQWFVAVLAEIGARG